MIWLQFLKVISFTDFDEHDEGSSGGIIINDFSRFTKKNKSEEKDSSGEMYKLGWAKFTL